MNAFAILLPVIFPIIAGACLLPVKFSDRKARQKVVLPIIVLNAIFALYAIFFADSGAITIFRFSNRLSLALHVDGLSKIFGTMVSLLWIPTTIYAFEYMTHEGHEDRFFSFFTMTFGVVIGIAFADNFLTMYLFYEFLTLVTLPIVMHQFDNKARHAGKTYVLYMMFGASLAFIGFVFVLFYGTTTDFVYGGVLNPDLIAGNDAFPVRFFKMQQNLYKNQGNDLSLAPFSAMIEGKSSENEDHAMRMRKKKNLLPRMERCEAYQIKDPYARKGHWRELMPEAKEIRVELGCGKGRFTVETAAAEPDVLLIAVEKVPDAMVVAMERAAGAGLRNVFFIDIDANQLPEIFDQGEVDRIYVNFCDPWPPKRQAKRRLTHGNFLKLYRKVLKENGQIHFKTDNDPLFLWSIEEIPQFGFALSEVTRDLHANGQRGVMTDYEAKFYAEGKNINRCVATMQPWEEPEEEEKAEDTEETAE